MSDALSLFEAEVGDYVRPSMEEIRGREKNGLRAVGSFSGCGGSSLGLRMAGWTVDYAIEFIEAAADTYEANAPGTFVDRRDIRKVQPEEILSRIGLERGELDLFEGSPPCASFSAAGQREKGWGKEKKYSDSRQRTDDLFWEWSRILEGLYPRAFIAENVPGMLAGNALEEYAWKIIKDLKDLGYSVEAKVMDSQHFGVPQERKRLIFIGVRRDVLGFGEESDYFPRFPAPTVEAPFTLKQALDAVPGLDPGHVADSSMEGKAVGRTWHAVQEARAAGKKFDQFRVPCRRCGVEFGRHQGAGKAGEKVRCADGEIAEVVKDYFMLTVPELDEPCPTVTATGAQVGAASVVHPTECRKFTPAELLSICGFPADFKLTGTREQQCERMGRTVTPPLYEALGERIASWLR
jgi:DNA (cytosine-5)-methyltransferase 1